MKAVIGGCPVERLDRELLVLAGWSDWVRAAQVIARNLKGHGHSTPR